MRPDGRAVNQLRSLAFQRGFSKNAPGSVLVSMGRTTVLCTCSIEPKVPDFLVGRGKGWLTAEYSMLPGSTLSRKPRDKGGKIDGRSIEIQRLIGRSLRAVLDLDKLGERSLWVDCDVVDADGGTRTASINGALIAAIDALYSIQAELASPIGEILRASVAAISVGIVEGEVRLDLEYVEDRDADVDMNLVMTGSGQFIEVQGSGEEATFNRQQFTSLVDMGIAGIEQITAIQKSILGERWPW